MSFDSCRASSSQSSSTRARPFDVLYNLSVHAEMLYPPSGDQNQVKINIAIAKSHSCPLVYSMSSNAA